MYYYILVIFAGITAGSVVFDLIDLTTWIGEDDDEVMDGIVTFLVYGRALDKALHRFLIDGMQLGPDITIANLLTFHCHRLFFNV